MTVQGKREGGGRREAFACRYRLNVDGEIMQNELRASYEYLRGGVEVVKLWV